MLNTLLLAAEHHQMGSFMKVLNFWSNLAFMVIFSLELVLKLWVYGPIGYVSDVMNVVDGIVVVHSLTELFFDTGISSLQAVRSLKGLRALRSFRALRAMRAMRYLTALPKIISVLFGCISSFLAVIALLFLF